MKRLHIEQLDWPADHAKEARPSGWTVLGAVVVMVLILVLGAGCASKPKAALPYHVPPAPELEQVQPAKSSPVRVIFIRPEARR